jgi:hypothetical protein
VPLVLSYFDGRDTVTVFTVVILKNMLSDCDSVGILAKKIKMAEILRWVKNPFFYLKNSKSEIFQKSFYSTK